MIRIICALLLMAISVTSAQALTTEALLDSLQHTAFQYFWNEANPGNGLIKDRSTSGSPASIAAVGFGLSAICIGIDHGWVSRTEGRDRVLTTLNTFWTGPQGSGTSGYIGYKGLFYHFLDMNTGLRTWDCELSTIDTALLFGRHPRRKAVLRHRRTRATSRSGSSPTRSTSAPTGTSSATSTRAS